MISSKHDAKGSPRSLSGSVFVGGLASKFFFVGECVWVNYNELTASSLEIIVSKGNHPQMAELFRSVNYYNLPRCVCVCVSRTSRRAPTLEPASILKTSPVCNTQPPRLFHTETQTTTLNMGRSYQLPQMDLL